MSLKDWFLGKKKPTEKKTLRKTDNSVLAKVYTPVNQLAIGMYVTELDRPWNETKFLFQGFELTSEADIQTVKNVCEYVYIDMTHRQSRKNLNKGGAGDKPKQNAQESVQKILSYGSPPKKTSVFEKEVIQAEKTYENTELLISDFMKKAVRGDGVDGWLAKQAVAECVNSILHSPDALVWLTQLKNRNEYAARHSLNVCILSIVLGRYLNLPEKNLNNLGLCGMMHDIGKTQIPMSILNKNTELTPDENLILQTHTTLGYELLRSSSDMHLSALSVALSHHERLDGRGYPRQLDRTSISDFARIVAIADMYDNIVNHRVRQQSRTHLDAITTLTNTAGTHLDSMLVVKFIESLGVYPPGCVVEMTNGAIGIVVEVNDKLKLRPKVILILDEEKKPTQEQMLDLSEMVVDKNDEPYTIKGIIKPEQWNIDPNKYYQEGLLQKTLNTKKKKR